MRLQEILEVRGVVAPEGNVPLQQPFEDAEVEQGVGSVCVIL
eukprot:CAMPEP_0194761756 /NCGR_PEP_ID=MMETSP0323_2-20130528/14406_1 /TAXON_ID=2866 ORGANISM="Crypthecodinium cohnii, Strain Seligo" /NCGR_SAMPLE_ID=MMETSP0323_2 /ASSEMBLY_ACC=CAM_ASM_000346 /LENGTH=41 /DNA_ID= /DNA_START= /DNA_END= /DNA_ORIENTATION=